jgi:hypothetical protein
MGQNLLTVAYNAATGAILWQGTEGETIDVRASNHVRR